MERGANYAKYFSPFRSLTTCELFTQVVVSRQKVIGSIFCFCLRFCFHVVLLGKGYNSVGTFCEGWAGNCGEGGKGASSWYLMCDRCREKYSFVQILMI